MHSSHNKAIAYVQRTCFAATFWERFLDLKAGVFHSLLSMLVLNVVGRLQIHLRSTWHATTSRTETCAAFLKDCMHVHVAGPGRTCTLLLASLSDADNQNKQDAACKVWVCITYFDMNIHVWCTHLHDVAIACRIENASIIKNAPLDNIASLFPPCRNETNTRNGEKFCR